MKNVHYFINYDKKQRSQQKFHILVLIYYIVRLLIYDRRFLTRKSVF